MLKNVTSLAIVAIHAAEKELPKIREKVLKQQVCPKHSRYQESFDLWCLAKSQLLLGLVGTAAWLLCARSVAAAFLGMAWHGSLPLR